MLCMIDPQFLAPDGASSPGAIAIGLLAETFSVLIINLLQDTLDTETEANKESHPKEPNKSVRGRLS